MSKKVMDFQQATAERIADVFRKGEQRRVLLADEVGLGKTIMAKAVIDKVREIRRSVNDDMYRVVYVCSNLNIIKQNMHNLGINDVLNITDSRLSMQHLTLEERLHDLKEKGEYREGKMPELLMPLTPGTSFNMSAPLGTQPERALLYNILIKMEEFKAAPRLKELFKSRYVSNDATWDMYVRGYKDRIEKCGEEYVDRIVKAFRAQADFDTFKSKLKEQCCLATPSNDVVDRCILSLRKMSAVISIQQLDPDLVIMDEFQRFSSLLQIDASDEQNLLTHEFFGDGDDSTKNHPLILLLSATPYKPYTTLEELNENNCDAQYEDFTSLMSFLFKNNSDVSFSKVWGDYSRSLSELQADNFTVLLAHKNDAEDMLYKTMCRTERPNMSLIVDKHDSLPISEGDVLSYAHMQKVFDDCKRLSDEHHLGFNSVNVPMDYVKSSPYLLSFMDKYELKSKITRIYSSVEEARLPVSQRQQTYLLREDPIYKYCKIDYNNARLELLTKEMFVNHAERLLWVPASHPYYTTSSANVFEKNKHFSKMLVFSAWEMVPRMIASMLSYEAERLTINQAFEDATYTNTKGRPQVSDTKLLCYPAKALTELYTPESYYGQALKDIQKALKELIKKKLLAINPELEFAGRVCNEKVVLNVCKALDNVEGCVLPERLSEKVIDILTKIAIGSPAVCAYRILKDADMAIGIAKEFETLFGRRTSAAIMAVIYERKDQDVYYEQVLDYCVMGNLQAVLDEFAFMIGGDANDIFTVMSESFVDMGSALECDTTASFANEGKKKWKMRVHYALPFNQAKVDEKKVKRSNSVRNAFNSPFRPFVLASTSVGQEGLDFHWYCRKIMHWNLPSNPQDLEQREGRINRFRCLAIRRNIANMYESYFGWQDMFDAAEKNLHEKYPQYNDMIPSWCLPPELITENQDSLEMIERIVPNYPMSVDGERYKRLIDVLSLYRLTMGQPRQEELLQLLAGKVNEDMIKQILFDLSPFSKEQKIRNNKDNNNEMPSPI